MIYFVKEVSVYQALASVEIRKQHKNISYLKNIKIVLRMKGFLDLVMKMCHKLREGFVGKLPLA